MSTYTYTLECDEPKVTDVNCPSPPAVGSNEEKVKKAEGWAKVGHSLIPIEKAMAKVPSAHYKAGVTL